MDLDGVEQNRFDGFGTTLLSPDGAVVLRKNNREDGFSLVDLGGTETGRVSGSLRPLARFPG